MTKLNLMRPNPSSPYYRLEFTNSLSCYTDYRCRAVLKDNETYSHSATIGLSKTDLIKLKKLIEEEIIEVKV